MGGQVEETNHCCQNNGRIVISRYIKKKISQERTNKSEWKYSVVHARRDRSVGVVGRQRHYAAARHVCPSVCPNSANQRRFTGREFIMYEGRGASVIWSCGASDVPVCLRLVVVMGFIETEGHFNEVPENTFYGVCLAKHSLACKMSSQS